MLSRDIIYPCQRCFVSTDTVFSSLVVRAQSLTTFMWSRPSGMLSFGSRPSRLHNRRAFAAPNSENFTFWLSSIANRLLSLKMSTLASKPVADAVDVSFTEDELVVTLADARRVSALLEWFPRLLSASPKQRSNWRLIGRGVGFHWEDVDEDISVRSLLAI